MINGPPQHYLLAEHDHTDITALTDAGISRKVATVLVTMHRYSKGQPVDSRWIERAADLRQPEVSIAIAVLETAGFVTVTEKRNHGKGRPVKFYLLKGSPGEYCKAHISEKLTALNKGIMAVNRIFAQGAAA